MGTSTTSLISEALTTVIYREGPLTDADYAEAIELLQDARSQLQPDGENCSVCGDSDHQAQECHHNPLVMARRAIAQRRPWRCFHCDVVFFDEEAARDHFGYSPSVAPACKRDHLCPICLGTGQTKQSNESAERALVQASLLINPCEGCASALRDGASPRSEMRCRNCKGGLRLRLAQMKHVQRQLTG